MKNASVLVLTDPKSPHYSDFDQLLRPYLDWFGFPYEERPLCSPGSMDYALILIPHKELSATAPALSAVRKAYDFGSGLCVFDPEILLKLGLGKPVSKSASGTQACLSTHPVCELHTAGDAINFRAPYSYQVTASVGTAAVTVGGAPLLEFGNRITLWHDMGWMSHSICGPLMGLDDLLWKSLVHVARKPFVMQGLPPLLGMRVDDVWGAWRDKTPENPLSWVEIVNSFGITPWLGVFQDNVNDATLHELQKHAEAGTATMFPHAFAGCEWVGSDLPEHWIWFDHNNRAPYDDKTIKENANRAARWFRGNKLPISKLALGHYYETGANALPYLIEMGCEYIGVHMTPDTPYRNDEPQWVKGGPYRKYEDGPHNSNIPVFYADYLRTDDPRTDGKLFNCVTEIRDVCGYEWAPTTDVPKTVENGIAQITRAFQSMVPAVFFTHESCWIQRMDPDTVTASFQGVFDGIERYSPICMSMEDICGYVRAKVGIKLHSAEVDGGNVKFRITGRNDRDTRFYLFTDTDVKLLTLPAVKGDGAVTL